jgi:hypothetical protein
MNTDNSKYIYTAQVGNITWKSSDENSQPGTIGGIQLTLFNQETGETKEINVPKRVLLELQEEQNKLLNDKTTDIRLRLRAAVEQSDDEAILNCFKEYEEIFKDYVTIKS